MKKLLLLSMYMLTFVSMYASFEADNALIEQQRSLDSINNQVVDTFKKDGFSKSFKKYTNLFKYGTYQPVANFSVDPEINHKNKQTFKDFNLLAGKSFVEFEDDFRSKYNKLNIPRIDLSNSNPVGFGMVMKYMRLDMPTKYENTTKEELEAVDEFSKKMEEVHPFAIVASDCITKYSLNEPAAEWLMLHETGHAQKPRVIETIDHAKLVLTSIVPFIWGIHKKAPYRNIVTKLGSKALATLLIPSIFYCSAMRLEERRADNFANAHADKEALFGGIDVLNRAKNEFENIRNETIKNLPAFKYFPRFLDDPIHPSLDSRIAKIKKALKTRFNVEV